MTTPDIAIDGLPAEPEAPAPEAPAPEAPAPTEEERRRRRRKFLLLLLLGVLAGLLAVFTFWYLIYRKPISELPLPAIVQTQMPGFSFAAYDLDKPLDIAVAADGSRWYVTQGGGKSEDTLILDGRGARLGTLAPPASVVPQATQRYVAINPANGDVWATDRTAGAVFIYAADGTYKQAFEPSSPHVAWQPLGIAFDGKGNVYISDVGGAAQTVHEFTVDGQLVRDLGAGDGLTFPNGVAVDQAGNVYVADSNNGRLIAYDATGARVGIVPRGPAADQLGMPRGLAIDDRGHVYVVDTSAQRVQVYNALANGQVLPAYVNAFGSEGTVDGTFEFPNGIAVDGRGRIYIADWNNDRIQVWSY